MATRRMFSKTITSSSQFLMMPQSSQNLYFHLGMNADDDGFCEHFTIMRMTESKPDDLKVLHGKGFVKVFDDKVLVITDWKENNYLRSDRYTPSKYLEIYKEEISKLVDKTESGIPVVDQMATQVRVGKVRKGKVNTIATEVAEVFKIFEKLNPTILGMIGNKTQRKAADELLQKMTIQQIGAAVDFVAANNQDRFCPQISTPHSMMEKLGNLVAYRKKQTNGSQVIKI